MPILVLRSSSGSDDLSKLLVRTSNEQRRK